MINVFLFIRENLKGERYIEVDFYNEALYSEELYRRFIIQKGYRMSPEQENEFLELLDMNNLILRISESMEFFMNFEETGLLNGSFELPEDYTTKLILEKLYYSSFNAGPKEILYKSNLDWIAYYLDRIDCYNLIGSTPQAILDVPIKLLRVINDTKGIFLIEDAELRKDMITKYSRKANKILVRNITNPYQLKYLLEYDTYIHGIISKIIEDLYFALETCGSDETYELYRQYYEYLETCPEEWYVAPPSVEYIKLLLFKAKDKDDYYSKMNELIAKNNRAEDFAFEDEDFIIVVPNTCEEFIKEAKAQHNCLKSYINLVANGITNIVFVRRKSNYEESFVTVEINNDSLFQYRGRFNELPSGEVLAFLERFAEHYDFDYDPIEFVFCEQDKMDISHWLFISEYVKRHGVPADMPHFDPNQISLYEYCPECFLVG